MSDRVPKAEAVFEIEVTCATPSPIGRLRGGDAMMIPIAGGTVKGARLSGAVLAGGADWSIRYPDGLAVVDARYAIRADDGTIIQVFNAASARIVRDQPHASLTMLTSPRFVAPEGPHEWLNHGVFVGTLRPDTSGRPSVHIVVFNMV